MDYYVIRREGQIFGITTDRDKATHIIDEQKVLTPTIKIWMEAVDNLDGERLYCSSTPEEE